MNLLIARLGAAVTYFPSRASFLVKPSLESKICCRWLRVLRLRLRQRTSRPEVGAASRHFVSRVERQRCAPETLASTRYPASHPSRGSTRWISHFWAHPVSAFPLRTPAAHRPTPKSHRRGSPWTTTTGSHTTTRCSARTPAARRCPNPRRPRQSSRRWLRWRWTPTRTRLRSTPSSAASPPPPRARSTPSSRRPRSRSPPWAARAPSDDGPSGPPRSSERPAQMPTRKTPKTNAGFEPH